MRKNNPRFLKASSPPSLTLPPPWAGGSLPAHLASRAKRAGRQGEEGGRGFTLIETLLAITLAAIVIASSYNIFRMGIQIWRRTQGISLTERKALLALEKMGHDVRNSLKIKKTDQAFKIQKTTFEYEGDSRKFNLPAIVQGFSKRGEPITQYGRVGYVWNPSTRELCRSLENATDLFLRKKTSCQTLARQIKRIQFRYWLYKSLGENYSWYDRWASSKGLPQAVEVSMELALKSPEAKGELARRYRRTFLLPVGGKP